jgi:hypothetical protein
VTMQGLNLAKQSSLSSVSRTEANAVTRQGLNLAKQSSLSSSACPILTTTRPATLTPATLTQCYGATTHQPLTHLPMEPQGAFRSIRGCKVPWGRAEVEHLAAAMYAHLPQSARDIVMSCEGTKPITVCKVKNLVAGASREDVITNSVFLKPVVEQFPSSCPSNFFLADVVHFLHAHHFERKLLGSCPTVAKAEALKAGDRLRSCLSTLRLLKRQSEGSADGVLHHLKALVQVPGKRARAAFPSSGRSIGQELKEAAALKACRVYVLCCVSACALTRTSQRWTWRKR